MYQITAKVFRPGNSKALRLPPGAQREAKILRGDADGDGVHRHGSDRRGSPVEGVARAVGFVS
jgi:hypothetical protein